MKETEEYELKPLQIRQWGSMIQAKEKQNIKHHVKTPNDIASRQTNMINLSKRIQGKLP